MFELKEILVENGRVHYNYSTSKEISKFFSKNKFYIKSEVDFSEVPIEILTIPLLGNILPISWFAGFDIKVEKLDKEFYEAANKLKQQFSEYYPIINSNTSRLIVDEVIEVKRETTNKTAMLFSGGVDAYTTLLRHYEEKPDLITIKGADIDIKDENQWKNVEAYNNSTKAIEPNHKYSLEINLREFITFEVDKLMDGWGWWGKIQHGMALTTAIAPLAYINRYNLLYIGSTRSSKMPFSPWGSMPETDELVKYMGTNIIHDGYELTRLDKVKTIVNLSDRYSIKPLLRVCYNDFKEGLNCGKCEKCCRTIFAIQLQNKNPNEYGLNTDKTVYDYIKNHLKNGFSTEGTKFYWKEMIAKIEKDNFYYFNDPAEEISHLNEIIDLNKLAQEKGIQKKGKSSLSVLKFNLINKFPKLFSIYLNIRRKFS